MDTDNRMVVTRGKRGGGKTKESKGGQIHGDGERLDFGWGAHNRVYRYYKGVHLKFI